MYNGLPTNVYLSYFSEGNKDNNYTLLVRKDNGVSIYISISIHLLCIVLLIKKKFNIFYSKEIILLLLNTIY